MKKLNKRGYTLIEMVLVIAIIVIITIVIIFNVTTYLGKTKEAASSVESHNSEASSLVSVIEEET